MLDKNQDNYNQNIMIQGNSKQKNKDKKYKIKILLRVRPLINIQQQRTSNNNNKQVVFVKNDKQTIQIVDQQIQSLFQIKVDIALAPTDTQKKVFQPFQSVIPKILLGYNITIFAYGQTGSGKTHTMFGLDWQSETLLKIQNKQKNNQKDLTNHQKVNKKEITKQNSKKQKLKYLLEQDQNKAGIIPRAIAKLLSLFQQQEQLLTKYNVYCSFIEIYNEKIYDILYSNELNSNKSSSMKYKPLNIRQSKQQGIFIQGLLQYKIMQFEDCLDLLKRGWKNRAVRSTAYNSKSSRSHSIFQIIVQNLTPNLKKQGQIHNNPIISYKRSKMTLCDLAGSQKMVKDYGKNIGSPSKKKQNNIIQSEQHFQQLKFINLSLSALGKVISSLSEINTNNTHNNQGIIKQSLFRQSKLTRLLQDSLIGNGYTFIIGNVSASKNCIQETINTIKFVQRAKHIVLKVKPNIFTINNLNISLKGNGNAPSNIQRKSEIKIVGSLNKEIKELFQSKKKGVNPQVLQEKMKILEEENKKLKSDLPSKKKLEQLMYENRFMKVQLIRKQKQLLKGKKQQNKSKFFGVKNKKGKRKSKVEDQISEQSDKIISSKASDYQPMFATKSSFSQQFQKQKNQIKKGGIFSSLLGSSNNDKNRNYRSIQVSKNNIPKDNDPKNNRLAQIGARILGDEQIHNQKKARIQRADQKNKILQKYKKYQDKLQRYAINYEIDPLQPNKHQNDSYQFAQQKHQNQKRLNNKSLLLTKQIKQLQTIQQIEKSPYYHQHLYQVNQINNHRNNKFINYRNAKKYQAENQQDKNINYQDMKMHIPQKNNNKDIQKMKINKINIKKGIQKEKQMYGKIQELQDKLFRK